MIIQGKDWIFVHNPKCAGSNVKHLLSKYGDRGGGHAHLGYRDLPKDLQKKWSFAFVRNPYDRMVSTYEFIRSRLRINGKAHYGWVHDITAAEKSFKEWLMESEFWEDNFRYKEIPPVQKRSQSYYLTLDDENIVVDFVGKTETFEEDMKKVCARVGAPYMEHRVNSNPHSDYREYYDDETKAWIEKYFAWDIETFGYEF